MKNTFIILIAVSLGCFFITNSYAQNFNDALRLSMTGINSNPRAMAMGDAYTSLSNDFSATLFNPAGLGLVKRMEVTGSLNSFSLNNSVDFFNNTSDYSNSTTDMNQVGFVFPLPTYRGSMVFALGYNRVMEFNSAMKFNGFNSGNNSMIQYLSGYEEISHLLYLTDESGNITPINGLLNQRGDILVSGSIGAWALSAAMEISKNVYVGATINILSGKYESDRRYYEEDINNYYDASVRTDPDEADTEDFELFYLNDYLDWDISGWDFRIGFLYDMPGFFKVGATVKFPTQLDIKEAYNVYAKSEFGTGILFELDPQILNRREYEITTPYEFAVGGSFDIADVIVSADIKFIDYTQMEFSNGLTATERSDNNRDIKELFRSVLNYNLGFEYELPVFHVLLRGGFIYQRSPFKGDPSDYDRKYFTSGIGLNASSALRLDIAYVHGWWKNFGDNYDSGVSRTYQDITSDNVVFGVTYVLR